MPRVLVATQLRAVAPQCHSSAVFRHNVEDAFAASRPAKNLVYALFQVLRILLPTERGLVARFKNRQCIDECE
jgi:hypothetical protein